jgi:hypothetical protein
MSSSGAPRERVGITAEEVIAEWGVDTGTVAAQRFRDIVALSGGSVLIVWDGICRHAKDDKEKAINLIVKDVLCMRKEDDSVPFYATALAESLYTALYNKCAFGSQRQVTRNAFTLMMVNEEKREEDKVATWVSTHCCRAEAVVV